jgi:hypothetical protein
VGRLLLQLVLGFLEQVLALAPGLFCNPRGLLPGHIGHLLSGLNAAVTQASRLILDQLGRALFLRRRFTGLRRGGSGQIVVCHPGSSPRGM